MHASLSEILSRQFYFIVQNTQEGNVKIGVDGKQNKPKNQTTTTNLCRYEFYVAHIIPNCRVRARW